MNGHEILILGLLGALLLTREAMHIRRRKQKERDDVTHRD